ncbi:MAG: tyrosine--tRNA ligase [Mycoplasmataceae bacterium]|nr:tyrosine--tRNA ligase [Mycoplasmataceae bacterium]
MSSIYDDLKWRGLIADISSSEKIKNFFDKKLSAYVGFDPSFKSLHLGNYVTLTLVRRLTDAGHKVYGIVGGMTGLIGDPRDPKLSVSATLERQLKTKEEIESNVASIRQQLITYSHATDVFNNASFYKNMTVADYLRDIGKLINVNYLLEKEIIARRLETGISYAEFSYTLLQGYDSLYLYKNHDVVCQFGGADQWGNITTGLEMIRKTVGFKNQSCCFSVPLLLKPDGTKFGKSEKGAIFLDKNLTSPYEMYQFFINQPDEQVEELIKKFTFLSKDEIKKIIALHNKEPFKRIAQKCLAQAVVTDIHGNDEFEKCQKISNALFNDKLNSLTTSELFSALQGVNKYTVEDSKINICDLLVNAQISKSKSDARKLIKQNAISVNSTVINDFEFTLDKSQMIDNKFSYVKKGKKDYLLVLFK